MQNIIGMAQHVICRILLGSRASPTSAGPSSRAGWTPRRGGGQLCVAASRVGLPAHLRFAVPWDEEAGSFRTRNIVFRDALTS